MENLKLIFFLIHFHTFEFIIFFIYLNQNKKKYIKKIINNKNYKNKKTKKPSKIVIYSNIFIHLIFFEKYLKNNQIDKN